MAPDKGARSDARALVIEDCAGWLHDAPGDVGVVLCSPWGFEELCLRRSWRMLADRLADAGYPTIRFDYPGCGDSLDLPEDGPGLGRMVGAAVAASQRLRADGANHVVLVGQGVGAVVAALAASDSRAGGLALLAPPAKGRDYLRELSVWGAMVASSMHLELDGSTPGSVAGFGFPERLAATLGAANLVDLEQAPAERVLIAARVGRAGDVRVAERFKALGAAVSLVEYVGYEQALGNPTAARPPVATLESVVSWVSAQFPAEPRLGRKVGAEPAALTGPTFRETTVRVGPSSLHAVLCEPLTPRRGASVLMLSAGGDPHIGWARGHVQQARALAAAGVASLRLDAWDVGDSPGPLSDEAPRLYDGRHVADAQEAIAWMQARDLGPVLPVGRCSGAYAAFNALLEVDGVEEAILVNQRRFVWHEGGEVEAATDKVGHYRRQLGNPLRLLARWVRGDLDLEAALARLAPAAVALARGVLGGHRRGLEREVHDAFRKLSRRQVRLGLVYSRGGEAHRDLSALLGADGKSLRRYGNVEFQWLEGADHALTPTAARAALLELVRDRALAPSLVAVGAEDASARRQDLTVRAALAPGVLAA